ncbi:MAG TPA: hypothetical protein EYN66_02815 [Myxococcales bacterium]|nr:hypothetical protein [Myxococcales bacterium]
MELLKALAISLSMFGFLIVDGHASDHIYAFDVIHGNPNWEPWTKANDNITIDLVFNDGINTSGTTSCPTVKACYLAVLQYEYRMGERIRECATITINRNGKVVWHRDYTK